MQINVNVFLKLTIVKWKKKKLYQFYIFFSIKEKHWDIQRMIIVHVNYAYNNAMLNEYHL